MTLEITTLVFVFLVSALAGAVNSAAAGGTLITFPSLLAFGMGPKAANMTSTVGLFPGAIGAAWGYRQQMAGGKWEVIMLALPSLLGGATGALILHLMPDTLFEQVVPWLILGATMLFMVQQPISKWIEGRLKGDRLHDAPMTSGRWTITIVTQYLVSIYGGYFGAGMGIMLLAAFGLLGIENLHRRNGLKCISGMLVNGVAAFIFYLSGLVVWPVAVAMMIGSILGGYLGARLAIRVGQKQVRAFVIFVGLASAAWTAFDTAM